MIYTDWKQKDGKIYVVQTIHIRQQTRDKDTEIKG